MLGGLSGRTHRVHTGVAVAADGAVSSHVTTTEVTFRMLSADDIEAYLASGEPFDKAGAYAIQGRAGAFVASVAGSVSQRRRPAPGPDGGAAGRGGTGPHHVGPAPALITPAVSGGSAARR